MLSSLVTIVGYPDNLLNDDALEKMYEQLEIYQGSFLKSSENLTSFTRQYTEQIPKPKEDWFYYQEYTITANAGYSLFLKKIGNYRLLK